MPDGLALLALLAAGAAAGLLSGLVGIGGGLLLVPFLYLLFADPRGIPIDASAATVIAHATSLATIVPTALRGSWVYHRAGLVVWRAAVPMGLAAAVSAAIVARIAPDVPPGLLRAAFGVLLITVGLQLAAGRDRVVPTPGRPVSRPTLIAGGLVVGAVSALLGIGGGLVAIPFLIHGARVEMRRIAATSLAVVGIGAVAGAASYAASAVPIAWALPVGMVGYVYLVAAVVMLPGAFAAVGLGARLNQRLPERQLRWLFATLFCGLGIRLLVQHGADAIG